MSIEVPSPRWTPGPARRSNGSPRPVPPAVPARPFARCCRRATSAPPTPCRRRGSRARSRPEIAVVGRKIGLTNPAVQAQLGVDQPDFGTLLSTMDCPPGEPIDTGRLLQPKIEAEVAFVLARDLDAPDLGPDDVLAATGSVAAALEIVDSRDRRLGHLHRRHRRRQRLVRTVHARSGAPPTDGLDLAACSDAAVARRRGGVHRIRRRAASAIRPSRSPGSPPPPGRTASRSSGET